MSELEISRLERELDDYHYRLKDADKENARLHADLAAERERADKLDRAWIASNLELTKALERVAKLREALERIAAIEDKAVGGDWEEIEEARTIARAVLEETKGDGDD